MSQKQSVSSEEIIKSYNALDNDMVFIDTVNARSDKNNIIRYKTYINLVDDQGNIIEKKLAYIKIPPNTLINGCKPYEDRIKKQLSAGFSIKKSSNLALYYFAKCWAYQANLLANDHNTTSYYFHQDKLKNGEPLDDPLVRIKIRAQSKDSHELMRPIFRVSDHGTSKKTENDQPINLINVHEVVRSQSRILAVLDFTQTIYSAQGISSSASVEIMHIVPGRYGLSENEYDEDDLFLLTNGSHLVMERD